MWPKIQEFAVYYRLMPFRLSALWSFNSSTVFDFKYPRKTPYIHHKTLRRSGHFGIEDESSPLYEELSPNHTFASPRPQRVERPTPDPSLDPDALVVSSRIKLGT
jgi:hypothetical protein